MSKKIKKTAKSPAAEATSRGDVLDMIGDDDVQAWLKKQIEVSDTEVRLGPGGTWAYNETKRDSVQAVNDFLHALAAIKKT